jgi:hypothetical protein
MPDSEFSQRDRVLAHITRALLAGLLVQVGDKVLALREPGEVIDDGEHVVPITEGGLYQGIDSVRSADDTETSRRSWVIAYNEGCSPRPFLRRILDTLSDRAITRIETAFNTSSVIIISGEANTATRTTMRLAKSPTTIVMSPQNHLGSVDIRRS